MVLAKSIMEVFREDEPPKKTTWDSRLVYLVFCDFSICICLLFLLFLFFFFYIFE